jgi:hypothetical protein
MVIKKFKFLPAKCEFNIQWHYSLNISEESDSAKYISLKTLWNNRNIVGQNDFEDDIFNAGTGTLAQVFNVNIDKQRIDSVHIKSNMRVWVESASFLKAFIRF